MARRAAGKISPPADYRTACRRSCADVRNTTAFDAHAARWDDAQKLRRAEQVAAALRREVELRPSMKALEYGAGTGLLSFCLRGSVGPITLAERCAGMRAVAERKIAAANASDPRGLDFDLMRDPVPAQHYDLIFSMMTLHHVADVPRLLVAFYAMLNADGWRCRADLDAEDGSFHGSGAEVHQGFERAALRSWRAPARFQDALVGDCCTLEHHDRDSSAFPATARKT